MVTQHNKCDSFTEYKSDLHVHTRSFTFPYLISQTHYHYERVTSALQLCSVNTGRQLKWYQHGEQDIFSECQVCHYKELDTHERFS